MKFIALKTKDGKERGKIAFYCRVLEVTRQGFYDYLKNRDKPWKYEALAAEMMEIIDEDECNDIQMVIIENYFIILDLSNFCYTFRCCKRKRNARKSFDICGFTGRALLRLLKRKV